MPWIHAFASKPTIQSICSNSWGNNCWTSHWSSHRKSSWQLWTWNRSSISTWSNTDIFCSVFASLRGRIAYPKCQIYSHQRGIGHSTCKTQMKANLAWRSRRLASRKLDADSISVSSCPVYLYTKRTILTTERKWKLIPANSTYGEDLFQQRSPKWSQRLVRHYDLEDRHCDAAVHWNTTRPKLLKAFARDFSEKDWLRLIHEGSNNCAWIDGHDWKEFVFHKGLFFQHPLHPWERTHCRRKTKQGRTTDHLLHISQPVRRKSRWRSTQWWLHNSSKKVRYHSNWKRNQDAVYCVKLSRAQDQGFRFWQTKSRAIIVHNPVPADCIYRVISQKGDRTLSNDVPFGSGKPVAIETGERDVTGNTTEDPGHSSSRKLVRNSESLVTKKPHFEIDLRVEGVSRGAILQDEEQIKEISKKVGKVENWFNQVPEMVLKEVTTCGSKVVPELRCASCATTRVVERRWSIGDRFRRANKEPKVLKTCHVFFLQKSVPKRCCDDDMCLQ